jgi:hypothetical protein
MMPIMSKARGIWIILAATLALGCRSNNNNDKGGTPPPEGGSGGTTPPGPAQLGPGVYTRSNDVKRTGANLLETTLTPESVNGGSFGKLYCRPVDHEIYGQMLYASGVDLGAKGKRNAIYVVTMQSSVYAFDAEDGAAPSFWEKHYADASTGLSPVPVADVGQICIMYNGRYNDISSFIGILSTPVIDPASQTMYFVARFKDGAGNFLQRLHAVSLADGSDRAGSPVVIEASIAGTGEASVGGMVSFDPRTQNQRAGLLLHDGVVYIAWASHCDQAPYHGWVIGYDAKTLQRAVVFNTSPNGKAAGIWMAGQAPAVDDDGNIHLITGNGTADLQDGPNRGESFLKLRRQGDTLAVLDWFTPFNYAVLEREDRDLGSAGALVIPGGKIVLGGGKEGRIYVLDRANMGKFHTGDDGQIMQSIAVTGATRAHIHGTPAYWKSTEGEFVYVMAEQDYLKQYRIVDGNRLELYKMSTVRGPDMDPDAGYTMPGGMLSISASGDKPESGIIWVSMIVDKNAIHKVVPGVVRAFRASDVSQELWNSRDNIARDDAGNFAKFNPVTVYGGKVYVPTFSNQYCVYGKLP